MTYEYFDFQDGVQKYDFKLFCNKTTTLNTKHILYDLPINGKYIKFGAQFRFDTLN